jgi:flagellar protein FlgJ
MTVEPFKHAKHHLLPPVVHAAKHAGGTATFIALATPAAQRCERDTGVPASITIAQAIVESFWGKYAGGSDVNNYFGVQAAPLNGGKHDVGDIATGFKELHTTEEVKGKRIPKVETFRTYKDMTDSFTDHGRFITRNKNYKTALDAYKKNGDADAFAYALQKNRYASASNYAVTLIKVMKQRKLYQYNKSTALSATPNRPSLAMTK